MENVTQNPLFRNVAFVAGIVLVIGAWKYIIEAR